MSEAPGWAAIDEALSKVYGETRPLHWGTVIKWALGGSDPLDGISAYARDDHWHVVGLGLSELYEKETDDASVSGFGFELTFRLHRAEGETQPPNWSLNFMQNLARYVCQTGNVFGAGHHMSLNGPIALGDPTAITAITFAEDPELPPITTPNGSLAFLQIIGITDDELQAIQSWNSDSFIALLRARSPLLVTDLARPSLLEDPAAKREIEEGIAREGSSMGEIFGPVVRWQRTASGARITIGAMIVSKLVMMLRGRIPFGRPFMMVGAGNDASHVVAFRPAEASGWNVANHLVLELTSGKATELAASLPEKRGVYPLLPGIELEVEPTEIKDQQGNVMKTIG